MMLMPPIACDWDEGKRRANIAKHGVDFAEAIEVFDDPLVEIGIDGRHDYGEERLVATGWVGDRLVVVVHTQRDDVIRVISARRAATHERRAFEDGTL